MRYEIDELDRINKAGDRYGHITAGIVAELIEEVRRLREENASLLKAGEEILDWTEVKHRPPIPEAIPCGEMAGVRVHALVGLRQAIDAARKEKP